MSAETLRRVREVVEAWERAEASPRRAIHFMQQILAILAAEPAPEAQGAEDAFVIEALTAAGHVTNLQVHKARLIFRELPGTPPQPATEMPE